MCFSYAHKIHRHHKGHDVVVHLVGGEFLNGKVENVFSDYFTFFVKGSLNPVSIQLCNVTYVEDVSK